MAIKVKTLEKRCIQRIFPGIVNEEDRCKKPCKGYDKFCPNYAPLEAFNLSEIERELDYRENIPNINIPQGLNI